MPTPLSGHRSLYHDGFARHGAPGPTRSWASIESIKAIRRHHGPVRWARLRRNTTCRCGEPRPVRGGGRGWRAWLRPGVCEPCVVEAGSLAAFRVWP